MSSNPYHNHSVITRSNYEEYFLLYVDDELTADEKAAVDQFLLLNPDLAQELEILQQAKLPEDFILMDEKEALFSGSMKMKASEESLLLYIDNELDEAGKTAVEARLNEDASYRLQYDLLLKTKSNAEEVVTCTFKEELYRHERRRIPVLWLRIAAAVLVVLSTGIFILTSQQVDHSGSVAINEPGQNTPETAETGIQTKPGQQTTPAEIASGETPKDSSGEDTSVPAVTVDEQEVPVLAMHKIERSTQAKKEDDSKIGSDATNVGVDIAYNAPERRNVDHVLTPELVEEPVKKSLTQGTVTSDNRYAYNSLDAPVNSVPADADDTEKSRSSLKGLLRKATRFVERRANINVTNDNDELLIGAVAISLK